MRSTRVPARLALVATLIAAAAPPAAGAADLYLSWDPCPSRAYDRGFACDTNEGEEVLWASFVAPAGAPLVSRFRMELEFFKSWAVEPPFAQFPVWWDFTPGGCREGQLVVSTDFTGRSECSDWSGGSEVASIARDWIDMAHNGYWVERLTVAATPLTPVTLQPGTTYYAVRLRILHALTTGAGACGGCDRAGCLGFSQLDLVRPDGTTVSLYGTPPDDLVLWQGGVPGDPNCSLAVPARSRTWGSLKFLYR